jgi:hypothetical protein
MVVHEESMISTLCKGTGGHFDAAVAYRIDRTLAMPYLWKVRLIYVISGNPPESAVLAALRGIPLGRSAA